MVPPLLSYSCNLTLTLTRAPAAQPSRSTAIKIATSGRTGQSRAAREIRVSVAARRSAAPCTACDVCDCASRCLLGMINKAAPCDSRGVRTRGALPRWRRTPQACRDPRAVQSSHRPPPPRVQGARVQGGARARVQGGARDQARAGREARAGGEAGVRAGALQGAQGLGGRRIPWLVLSPRRALSITSL